MTSDPNHSRNDQMVDPSSNPSEVEAVDQTGPAETADPMGAMAAALGGGLDFGAMMQAAQSMQAQVASAQEQLAEARVLGTSGGELVSVTLNGHLHLLDVKIDPKAVDADDPSILEDLIRAAWQDAHDQVAVLQQQADPMSSLLGGGLGGGSLGGGSLGGLGDLLGGL